MSDYNIGKIQDKIKEEISGKRYIHTLGVQFTAANLAMRYNYCINAAQIAGLLHDCAKNLSDEKMLKECRKYNITITDVELRNPYLLHGKLGSYYAKTKYNIKENDILNSISYHTTGRPAMTLLEKIIFTADYIEPGRKLIPRMDFIRKTAYCDLDKAVYFILKDILSYLENKNTKQEIDPMTISAYLYYKTTIGKENENGSF